MLTAALSAIGFAAVMMLIGLGTLLGKRTPLKGSCRSALDDPEQKRSCCPSCNCGSRDPSVGGCK
ncbi:MAG: hypothetical protein R6V85_12820 [Polyangia bacterium]